MPFKKYYAKSKKTATRKAKSTKKKPVKSKLTLGQKKEVKRLIHNDTENKYVFTGSSISNSSTAPYNLAFQGWAVVSNLPIVPIIQNTNTTPSYPSVDEQIIKGLSSGQRIGSQIRVMKLLLHYTISIPIQYNTVYGYRYKVKAIIYKNKDSNEPFQQFGAGSNGYSIFKNGLSTLSTNLCIPSGTHSDFVAIIDPSIYKVCYTEVFEMTPPTFKDYNGGDQKS